MRLYAGLLPPQQVMDDLDAVVRSAGRDPAELESVEVRSAHVPVTTFGNVAHSDAVALGNALEKEAAQWPPMELRFAGGTALEWPGDDSVWAKLEGDIEQLETVGREVPVVVQRLGFLVDRRTFRTWLRVGRITSTTTPEFLNRLVDSLEAYRGPSWTIREVCLLRRRQSALDSESLEVYRPIPLGGA